MSMEILTALALFAFVSSVTPGPNNLMLMASGANFGFRRTIPHMLGIGVGFTVMIVLVGLGLIQVFDAYPIAHTILKVGSVVYLLYLAWKIANAAAPSEGAQSGSPWSLGQLICRRCPAGRFWANRCGGFCRTLRGCECSIGRWRRL